MFAIVIIYLLLQVGATIFLYLQHHNKVYFHSHLALTLIAAIFYCLAHFIKPGYINSEQNKLNTLKVQQSSNIQLGPSKNQPSIDKKFCNTCKEDQLLRMKHCYDCRLCVATFDHHCFWLDNCVGEKNRPAFYLCIWTNLIQIISGSVNLVRQMFEQGQWFPYQITFLSIVFIIGSGVLALTVLHTYLMIKNLTTWEVICWGKIYYLLDFQKSNGSPFSRGCIGNVVDYFKASVQKGFKDWQFNSSSLQRLKKNSQIDANKQKD